MPDITIGSGGVKPPEISKESPLECVAVSGRKIGLLNNENDNIKPADRITVKVYLHPLEKDRVRVEVTEVTFKDILDEISDVDNLNVFRYEIENQIENINFSKETEKLEKFSVDCLKEIEDKINDIANQPKEGESGVPGVKNQDPNEKTLKLAVPLNNQPAISRYAARIIHNQINYPLARNYIDNRVKELPVAPKTKICSKKGYLSFMNSEERSVPRSPIGQNNAQKRFVGTGDLRFSGQNTPPWIATRLVKKEQLAGTTVSDSSVSITTRKEAPSTTGNNTTVSYSSIATGSNKAALSTKGDDITIDNHSTAEKNQPLKKDDPPNNPLPLSPILQSNILSSFHPMMVAQFNSQLSKEVIISKNNSGKAASEHQILQQIIDDLNNLENLFSEENRDVNKKEPLTLAYLESNLSSSIKKFIQQQLVRGDPCSAEEIINNKLKAVRALKDRLEQGQKTAHVNKALDLLQDSIRDLTESWEKTSEACRKRKIVLSTNFI